MQHVFLSLCRLEICLVSVCSGCEGYRGGTVRFGGAIVTTSRGHDFNGAAVAGLSASVAYNS